MSEIWNRWLDLAYGFVYSVVPILLIFVLMFVAVLASAYLMTISAWLIPLSLLGIVAAISFGIILLDDLMDKNGY